MASVGDQWAFAGTSMAAVFVVGMVGGSVPWMVANGVLSPGKLLLLSLLNCFAGGVLLAAGFAHMLPDAVAGAVALGVDDVPTPYIFIMVGLMLPFVIEKSGVVPAAVAACHRPTARFSAVLRKTASRAGLVEGVGLLDGRTSAQKDAEAARIKAAEEASAEHRDHVHDSTTLVSGACVECGERLQGACKITHKRHHNSEPSDKAGEGARTWTGMALAPVRGTHHGVMLDSDAVSSIPLLLGVVLGVHSFIAGLSLGASASSVKASIGILVGILFHKAFSALALGMAFRQAGASMYNGMKAIVMFSVMTPIGIAVGAALSISSSDSTSAEDLWIQVTFKCMAAGTFVFVSVCEIIQEELDHGKPVLFPMLAFIAGCGGMTVLGYYV